MASTTTTSADAAAAQPISHPLQTKWTFWYDKKVLELDPAQQATTYREHLKKVGTFETVEQFAKYYAFLERPSSLPKNSNYHLFRHEIVPMVT